MQARAREQQLETLVAQLQSSAATAAAAEASSNNSSDVEQQKLLLEQAQSRCGDLEKELEETKASIHEFLTEIDAVSNQEVTSRQQSERLLQQIHDYQSIQRDALQENMRLQSAVEDMQKSMKEMEQRTEMMKQLMLQQESTLTDIRNVEQTTRQEYHSLKHEHQRIQQERDTLSVQFQEMQQRLKDMEQEHQKTMKRNQELHQRCDALTAQAEEERKRRYVVWYALSCCDGFELVLWRMNTDTMKVVLMRRRNVNIKRNWRMPMRLVDLRRRMPMVAPVVNE